MSIVIQKSTVAHTESHPQFAALLAEYGDESATVGMPHPSAKLEFYKALELSGALHTFIALNGTELIGFITLLLPKLPHYDDAMVGVSESFFVASVHRRSGAGNALREAAEQFAHEQGACGVLFSAPVGSRLAFILENTDGYAPTNIAYFKGFKR